MGPMKWFSCLTEKLALNSGKAYANKMSLELKLTASRTKSKRVMRVFPH